MRVLINNVPPNPVNEAIVRLLKTPDLSAQRAGVLFAKSVVRFATGNIALGQIYLNGQALQLPPLVRLRYLESGQFRLYMSEEYHSGTGATLEVRVLRVAFPRDTVRQCVADCCDFYPYAN